MLRDRTILHEGLIRALVALRHADELVVADSGLPAPDTATIIDLGLTVGQPSVIDVLGLIVDQAAVESAVLATELSRVPLALDIRRVLGDIPVTEVDHASFIARARTCSVFVRTGECTPYSNAILIAGVTF